MTTLSDLNTCDEPAFADTLRGIYEHSPWIPRRAAHKRPFATVAALKLALQAALASATEDEQLRLIRGHPELAGKAASAGQLTQESANEQARSGLNECSADEYAALHKLNADYKLKFGFPFILAVKGPTGEGLARQAIIETLAPRLNNQRADEWPNACARSTHRRVAHQRPAVRAARIRPRHHAMGRGDRRLERCRRRPDLRVHDRRAPPHRGAAARLDARVGHGCAHRRGGQCGRALQVRRAGCEDADLRFALRHGARRRQVRRRLGILLPLAIVQHCTGAASGCRFISKSRFAPKEGVRFRSTFLGSNALAGQFDMTQLDQLDAGGASMRQVLADAGHDVDAIASVARDPASLLGFVEVHIEQGPVLLERGLALGVVTAIAGSSRYLAELTGLAGHAGTTPMGMRKDAAAAAAEIVLMVEQRCSQGAALVGTVGQLEVPNGSVNVIPGHCKLSLDIRAADDAVRLAAVRDVLDAIAAICAKRQVTAAIRQIVSAPAAPCAPWLMDQLGAAVERAGLPRYDLPSGAGHDAMAMAKVTDVAMLFTRCGNGGISHNRLETMTADDADIAATVLLDFFRSFHVRKS
jgi:N-carbamoyl-L-amino-acid hydrolase